MEFLVREGEAEKKEARIMYVCHTRSAGCLKKYGVANLQYFRNDAR